MSETVVPYERFLEIRRRRKRVVAEVAAHPGSTPDAESGNGDPATIDGEAVIDCGTVVDEPDSGKHVAAAWRRPDPLA